VQSKNLDIEPKKTEGFEEQPVIASSTPDALDLHANAQEKKNKT